MQIFFSLTWTNWDGDASKNIHYNVAIETFLFYKLSGMKNEISEFWNLEIGIEYEKISGDLYVYHTCNYFNLTPLD